VRDAGETVSSFGEGPGLLSARPVVYNKRADESLFFNSHYLFEMEKLAIRRQSSLRLLSHSPPPFLLLVDSSCVLPTYYSSPSIPPTTYRFSPGCLIYTLRAFVVSNNNKKERERER
jgi:hypothetical protein